MKNLIEVEKMELKKNVIKHFELEELEQRMEMKASWFAGTTGSGEGAGAGVGIKF